MEVRHFSTIAIFKEGFSKAYNNIGLFLAIYLLRALFWIGAFFLLAVVVGGKGQMHQVMTDRVVMMDHMANMMLYCVPLTHALSFFSVSGLSTIIASLIFFTFDSFFTLWLTIVALDIEATGRSSFTTITRCSLRLMFNNFLVTIMYATLVATGLLAILPGLIWALQYGFAQTALVDRALQPLEAMRASAALTKGIKLELFGFWFLVFIINALGSSLFGVGYFLTAPIMLMSSIILYKELLRQA